MTLRTFTAGLAAATVAIAAPALAQKSKDTLRVAMTDPPALLSPYDFGIEETSPHYRAVYSTLLRRNEYTGEYLPELAKAWHRSSPTSIDFDLRDDLTLHSGNHFSADDVVYTVEKLIDPKYNFRGKPRWRFLKSAEKLGPYKVRINTKSVNAVDMGMIAYLLYIMDGKVHASLKNPAEYGRVSAASAGPYRMVSIDRQKGFVLERFDGFRLDKKILPAPIKVIEGISMPDRQTQTAQLLTGGVEVLRNVEADVAKNLKANPNISVINRPSLTFVYLMLDAVGRSHHKPMQDVRVRKAIFKALDRTKIVRNFIPGGEDAELLESICFKATIDCTWSTKPYAYDLAGAKKLMAEAGYPNGFDLNFYVHQPIKQVGEVLAGELHKIGIRASVQSLPINVYVKKRSDGELTAFTGIRPTGSFPDVSYIMDSFYRGGRDYWKDPVMNKASKAGLVELDGEKRQDIYKPAIDRTNTEAYIYPISSLPTVYALSRDVEIRPSPYLSGDNNVNDFHWK